MDAGIRLPQVIEASDTELALGQHFLHFQQTLLGFGHQLAVGILQDHLRYSSSARLAWV